MKESEIADRGHWFTQRQSDRFYEKMVQLCGNRDIAREAGRYAFSTDALGGLREYFLALAGPEYLYDIVSRVAPTYTRSSRISSRRIGPREIEVTVSFEEGVHERPYQCENRMGFMEAGFQLFGYHTPPEISHPECVFEGASICRYRVTWEDSPAIRLVWLRRLSFLLLPVVAGCGFWLAPDTTVGLVFLGVFLTYLALVGWIQRLERASLRTSMAAMRSSGQQLLEELKGNYDAALMVNEIGEVFASRTDLDEILDSLNQVLKKRLDYTSGILLLGDADGSSLTLRSCFGLRDQDVEMLTQIDYSIDPPLPDGMLDHCFTHQRSLLVNDPNAPGVPLADPARAVLASLGIRSFICVPLVCEGESLGVFVVSDAKRDGELGPNDVRVLEGVAPVIGIAIRNARRLANERDLSEQLRKASDSLERRVEERTIELSRANEVLEFLYDSVSHDLRTPLRVIYGYGELLQELYGERLDDAGREYLASMIAGGERMEATLNRMLDFSQVRLMELSWQPVDLSRMAQRILADLTITDPKRQLACTIEDGVVVTGDEELLTSIMENLLGNAWKYSAGKGVTSICFGVKDSVFYVSDNGAGFDMAYANRLFAPFQRLHDGKTFAGHGLGLSMVRCMVERLGGKVWGVGTPGEGATFYFTIAPPR
ncbi:sensor histidine kinase [Geomonas limicola]|nr:ATP-binding protein [Geomonas limicola]